MADSVATNIPAVRVPREIFLNSLPPELYKFIFHHSNVVTLVHLSATCRILRLEVHNFFISRLSDQARKYPEIRDSLSRLGWTKKHNHWSCDCFKLVAGPGFTWAHLNERKFFSTVYGRAGVDSKVTFTTVDGKTFFLTSEKKIIFFENSTENPMMPTSPHTLVSFEGSPVDIGPLASYDQVLAFSIKEPAPNARHAICIYNPTTLTQVSEIDLIEHDSEIPQDIHDVKVTFIAFAKNTMAIHVEALVATGRNILIWKMNTKEPDEEGIVFLYKVASPPTDLINLAASGRILLNDRFIAIFEETQVKMIRRTDGAVVRQIGRGGAWGIGAWALESHQGDHIALALAFLFGWGGPKLVLQINSVSQGRIVVQKTVGEWPFPNVRYMKWFGPHLLVILEKENVLTMMSWQPGLSSFITCPLNIPVVRRSARVGEEFSEERGIRLPGDKPEWAADCVHVDYGGITLALKDGIWDESNHMWRYE